jgi:hypothetical protein
MAILAAVLLAVSPSPPALPAPHPVTAERQAVAVVRILPGAQFRYAELEKIAPASFTDAQIRDTDGSSRPARLIEFQ